MKIDIARAWKDAQYRESLSADEKALLPVNPVGALELTDGDLAVVNGACGGSCGGYGNGWGYGWGHGDGGWGHGGGDHDGGWGHGGGDHDGGWGHGGGNAGGSCCSAIVLCLDLF